jgi:molecular chaperone GrpE
MADPKKTETGLEDILSSVGDEEPVDIDALADEPDEREESSEGAQLRQELSALRSERDDYRDRYVRALADAENARKRGEKDRREAEHYGGTRLARDLLPVYDNLKRALAAASEEQRAADSALIEGVELTLKELLNIFEKHGIHRIAPQKGDRFDPQYHQAMFEAPVPDTQQGDIIEVMAEGFLLHDRLLRPAQVGVSSAPAQSAQAN